MGNDSIKNDLVRKLTAFLLQRRYYEPQVRSFMESLDTERIFAYQYEPGNIFLDTLYADFDNYVRDTKPAFVNDKPDNDITRENIINAISPYFDTVDNAAAYIDDVTKFTDIHDYVRLIMDVDGELRLDKIFADMAASAEFIDRVRGKYPERDDTIPKPAIDWAASGTITENEGWDE